MEKQMENNIEMELRSLVAEILEMDEEKISPDANFTQELGMDSMMALEILASAEKKYKIKIPEEHLTKITTLNNLADVVRKIREKE